MPCHPRTSSFGAASDEHRMAPFVNDLFKLVESRERQHRLISNTMHGLIDEMQEVTQ
jgi:hypothetical protein